VEDPSGLKVLLGAILGVRCVVRKERELGLYENVRIHLDRVEGLGSFVELEAVYDPEREDEGAQREKLRFLRDALGIRDEDLVAQSYADADSLRRERAAEPIAAGAVPERSGS
jgi:predicted adenylyl cyclase CyaB